MTSTTAEIFFSSTQPEEEQFNPDVCSPHCMEDETIKPSQHLSDSNNTMTSLFHSVQNLIIRFAGEGEKASLNNYESAMERTFAWLSEIPSELLETVEEQIYISVAFVNVIRRRKANVFVNQLFNEKGLNLDFGEDLLMQNVSKTLNALWMGSSMRISGCFAEHVASILTEAMLLTNDRKALETLHSLFELFCNMSNAGFWPEQRDNISKLLSYNSLNLFGHFTMYSLKKNSMNTAN